METFHGGFGDVIGALSRHSGMDVAELSEHSYVHYSAAAVEHLFYVSAGLDSMVVGEGIISMLGYEPDDEDPPAGALALAGGAGIAVFLVPCVVAWVLGRRAQASGEPQGNAPALVGAMVGAAFVALNLVGVVGRILGL